MPEEKVVYLAEFTDAYSLLDALGGYLYPCGDKGLLRIENDEGLLLSKVVVHESRLSDGSLVRSLRIK